MFTGIDSDEVFEYISPADEAEQKTVFLLAGLSVRAKLKVVKDSSAGGAFDQSKIDLFEVLLDGLRGIKGLKNKKSGVAENFEKIDIGVLAKLPAFLLAELAGQIIEKTFVSEIERKN